MLSILDSLTSILGFSPLCVTASLRERSLGCRYRFREGGEAKSVMKPVTQLDINLPRIRIVRPAERLTVIQQKTERERRA